MTRHFLYFILLITILTIVESCDTTSHLYSYNDENRNYNGQLSDTVFIALKQFLTTTTNSKLKDTIIIKYDYNNETCWYMLDKSEKKTIMGFIARDKERVQQILSARQNVSVFYFREPGNSLNKIKKWNKSIIIDSSKQLFNLLFKERCTCGSSIIVMPDKKFVFLRSDSHSAGLNLTKNQIEEILSKK